MNAEEAEALFWKAHGSVPWPTNKPHVTKEFRSYAWDQVIREIRKDFEVETERLRDENRVLRQLIIDINVRDAGWKVTRPGKVGNEHVG